MKAILFLILGAASIAMTGCDTVAVAAYDRPVRHGYYHSRPYYTSDRPYYATRRSYYSGYNRGYYRGDYGYRRTAYRNYDYPRYSRTTARVVID